MSKVLKHIRRWDPQPAGGRWTLTCDCGWHGHADQLDDQGRHRGRMEVDRELDAAFLGHLGAHERRTYLLVDARPPAGFREVHHIMEDDPKLSEQQAQAIFAEQAPIIGTFVMPEGVGVTLLSDRLFKGVHYGTYQEGSTTAELPIGEVRTPDARVFKL